MATVEIKVPDIGDFKDVPIIEVHVQPGDTGQCGGPAAHARIRQGDDGRAGARRPGPSRGEGQSRRPSLKGDLIVMHGAAGAAATPPKEKASQDAAPRRRAARRVTARRPGVYDTIR